MPVARNDGCLRAQPIRLLPHAADSCARHRRLHAVASERASAPVGRAEEGTFFIFPDARCFDVGVEIRLEIMVIWQLVTFAAFLLQADPPTFALGEVVLDIHRHGSISAISARSRRPTTVDTSMLSSSVRA